MFCLFRYLVASFKSCSKKEEDKLAAYFDGELSDEEAELFKREHSRGRSPHIEAQLEDFSELRSVFQSLVSEMYDETDQGAGRSSVWEQIEFKVQAEIRSREVEKRFTESYQPSNKFKEIFSPFLAPKTVFAAAVCALFAFSFGIQIGNEGRIGSEASFRNQASTGLQASVGQRLQKFDAGANSLASVADNKSSFSVASFSNRERASRDRNGPALSFRVSRELAKRRTLEHRLPFVVDTDQLIGIGGPESRSFGRIPGGLRAEGTDIDWIESDREFKILTTRRQNATPVIWVSGAK